MTTKRVWTAGIIAGCVLVLSSTTAVAAPPPSVPAKYTNPTAQMVAASILVWDPSGHVTGIETQTTDGDEAVLRLDSDILFAFGRAELSDIATKRIKTLVADIPKRATVSVVGYTDDIGSDADNLVLSQHRADAVAAAIKAARSDLILDVAGRGESEPAESNTDAKGREANRRVEIRYRR